MKNIREGHEAQQSFENFISGEFKRLSTPDFRRLVNAFYHVTE